MTSSDIISITKKKEKTFLDNSRNSWRSQEGILRDCLSFTMREVMMIKKFLPVDPMLSIFFYFFSLAILPFSLFLPLLSKVINAPSVSPFIMNNVSTVRVCHWLLLFLPANDSRYEDDGWPAKKLSPPEAPYDHRLLFLPLVSSCAAVQSMIHTQRFASRMSDYCEECVLLLWEPHMESEGNDDRNDDEKEINTFSGLSLFYSGCSEVNI